jgi:AcrR family transcriptional regulator
MPSQDTKTYHHKDLRCTLIEKAFHILAVGGSQAISLRDLAREIGVSHSAPLRHFPNKEALLAELAIEGFRQLTASMDEVGKNGGSNDAVEALQNVGIAYVRFAVRNPHLFRLMFTADRVDSARYGKLQEAGNQCKAALVNLVEIATKKGDLVPASPDIVALSCWAMVHGMASLAIDRQLDSTKDADVAEITRQLLDQLKHGIARKSKK